MIKTSKLIEEIDYEEYSNRQLLVVPLSIFALAVGVLVMWYVLTGSPVMLGVEFTGGTELRITPTDEIDQPRQAIYREFEINPSSIQQVPSNNAYIVTFRKGDISTLESQAEAAGFRVLSSSSISPSFGEQSQKLALIGLVIAFIGMSLIVFGLFRTFVPSIAVVASALSDLIVPLALMNILSIELSLGTVAALLMLIGYSVDSDMLLNDYVVRRGGSFYESVYTAMETGLTMTFTSIIAMGVMAIGGFLLGVPLLTEIGIIILVGLVVDIVNTYLLNVSLLRWYRFKGVNN